MMLYSNKFHASCRKHFESTESPAVTGFLISDIIPEIKILYFFLSYALNTALPASPPPPTKILE